MHNADLPEPHIRGNNVCKPARCNQDHRPILNPYRFPIRVHEYAVMQGVEEPFLVQQNPTHVQARKETPRDLNGGAVDPDRLGKIGRIALREIGGLNSDRANIWVIPNAPSIANVETCTAIFGEAVIGRYRNDSIIAAIKKVLQVDEPAIPTI
jgi:hypothetical protein